jgi:hypothetical protein
MPPKKLGQRLAYFVGKASPPYPLVKEPKAEFLLAEEVRRDASPTLAKGYNSFSELDAGALRWIFFLIRYVLIDQFV